jgi:hypothetical protein
MDKVVQFMTEDIVAEAYGPIWAPDCASAMDCLKSPNLSIDAPNHEILDLVCGNQRTVEQGQKNREVLILRVSKSFCAIYTQTHTMKRLTKAVKEREEVTAFPVVQIDTNCSARGILTHKQILAD